jgi:1-aminocyclopropane-1-carboxylate deaminase
VQNSIDIEHITVQAITANWLPASVLADVLRLDEIHPIVSGNKWFKLQYYLEEAGLRGHDTIATFGGAYSNHIVAAAYACRACGFKSIGIIRGERPLHLSPTLINAADYGMHLQFVSRDAFKDKETIKQQLHNVYWINEGGYGSLGAKGAGDILQLVKNIENYTHIICAVGTGTMFAGLVNRAKPNQEMIGISVLKNNFSIAGEVRALLDDKAKPFTILHDHHFGGYAKHPPELVDFMRETWHTSQLPTDIVYTAKTFYALKQLIISGSIPAGSRVLMIHSGGLQGNASLQKGVLPF